jgi:peptidoglycan/xylan/chitin deacetylase (PgdA/CDA1 family)
MPTLKSRVMPAVHRVAWAMGASTVRARGQPVMRILMFHSVGGDRYPEDVFRSQMEWLASRFRVVPLSEVVDRAAGGDAEPRREVALTFDDGLEEHARVVHPVLRRLGLPATFFLCPGRLGGGEWLWNQEARERMRSLGDEGVRGLFPGRGTYADVLSWMETLPLAERRAAEARIRDATPGFDPAAPRYAGYRLMSWSEAEALDRSLVSVGSHTVTHAMLPALTAAEQDEELSESRRLLESRLGGTVDLFCYPNGETDAAVVARTRRHYRAAVTVEPGFVRPGADLHALPRIAVAASSALLAWRLHRPTA